MPAVSFGAIEALYSKATSSKSNKNLLMNSNKSAVPTRSAKRLQLEESEATLTKTLMLWKHNLRSFLSNRFNKYKYNYKTPSNSTSPPTKRLSTTLMTSASTKTRSSNSLTSLITTAILCRARFSSRLQRCRHHQSIFQKGHRECRLATRSSKC